MEDGVILGQVLGWVNRYYVFATDRDNKRHRWLHSRTSYVKSEISEDWRKKLEEFDEISRILGNDLQRVILPHVSQRDMPQLKEALERAGKRLSDLRFAMRDISTDRDPQEEYDKKVRQLYREFDQEDNVIQRGCPSCSERFRGHRETMEHFVDNHQPPRKSDIILDPTLHLNHVVHATGPCCESAEELNSILALYEFPADSIEIPEPEPEPVSNDATEDRSDPDHLAAVFLKGVEAGKATLPEKAEEAVAPPSPEAARNYKHPFGVR